MFHLSARQHLRQRVHDHFVHWTIEELDRAVFDAESDVVVADVNVLGACVIASIFHECDC